MPEKQDFAVARSPKRLIFLPQPSSGMSVNQRLLNRLVACSSSESRDNQTGYDREDSAHTAVVVDNRY